MTAKIYFWILGLTTLTALTSWTLYTPLPAEFSDLWALRKLHYKFTGSMKLARWMDSFNVMPLSDGIRYLMPTSPIRVSGVIADDVDFGHVPVRLRIPRKKDENSSALRPAFLFIHGGAYVLGDRYSHDATLTEIAKQLDIIVVSVTYRLSPEAVWPAQLDDCMLVTRYLLQHGAQYGIDPTRIVIGGDSAGGHLTGAVTLKLRDERFPVRPKAQFLLYPVVQFYDLSLPSHVQNTAGPVLTRDIVLFSISNLLLGNQSIYWDLHHGMHVPRKIMTSARTRINHDYLPEWQRKIEPYDGPLKIQDGKPEIWTEIKESMMSPYFNLLTGDDLSDQPPTYIYTAQNDVLRDDGFLYARALREAGVEVMYFNHPIGVHGMFRFARALPEGRNLYDNLVEFLNMHLNEV